MAPLNKWPPGEGEMAERIRRHEWSGTALGPIGGWSATLRSAVALVIDNPLPAALAWGPELVMIYNDGFLLLHGARHPDSLGRPLAETSGDAWESVRPIAARALAGQSTVVENQPLLINRAGEPEQASFTISYCPIRSAEGQVLGMLETAIENDRRSSRAFEAALRKSEDQVHMVLEAGRMGTWRYDLASGTQEWSDQQFRLLGLEPGAKAPSRELFLSLVHPDDHHLIEFGPQDLLPGREFLDSEFRIIRPDGELRWLVAHTVVRRAPNGEPTELIGLNWDITQRKQSEIALRESEERFRQFGEASQDVLWIRDAETLHWVYLTPAFEVIYGLGREQAMGSLDFQTWIDLVVPEDRKRAVANIERVRAGEDVIFEYRIRRPSDGQIRWLRNTDFPITDEEGRVSLIGGIGHDITPVNEAEEHQKLLLSELQHRVRNTLAVIRSITRRTAVTTDSKDEFFMHLDGRIDAFARVQAAVTRDPSKGVDLAFLVAEELRVVGAQEGHGLKIQGPPIGLAPKAAETFGLAIHELATNAIKYGALSNSQGTIAVSWEVIENGEDRKLHFDWIERGVTAMASEPRRRGFGTEILERSLGYELKADTTLAFAPDGIRCRIVLPLDLISASGTGRAASGARAW